MSMTNPPVFHAVSFLYLHIGRDDGYFIENLAATRLDWKENAKGEAPGGR
jgi:hypothetical protein